MVAKGLTVISKNDHRDKWKVRNITKSVEGKLDIYLERTGSQSLTKIVTPEEIETNFYVPLQPHPEEVERERKSSSSKNAEKYPQFDQSDG